MITSSVGGALGNPKFQTITPDKPDDINFH